MQFTALLTVVFASVAAAAPDFAIGDGAIFSATDSAQFASITKALLSHQASLTAQPEWSSAWSALIEFQETGKNVPEDVTATDRVLTYATTPDWYKAMPTDLQNYLDKNRKEQAELIASVIKKTTGDAVRPPGMGVYISGAIAALVGGVAIAL